MWLDKLKDLKKRSGMTTKQIADKAKMAERTVTRVFSGETYAPGIDKLRDIVYAMGGSLDDILDESDFRLPTPEIQALKNDISTLQNTIDEMTARENELTAENVTLKDKNVTLEAEIDRLHLMLAHEEEMLAHKEEIMQLQRELLGIHKGNKPDNNVWKL